MKRTLIVCLALLVGTVWLVACQRQTAPREPLADRHYTGYSVAEAQVMDADRKFHNGALDYRTRVSAQVVAAADAKFWAQAAARRNVELDAAFAAADFKYHSGAMNYAAIRRRSELAVADAKLREGAALILAAGPRAPTAVQ